tara:strand:+ start:10514 stop:11194 length:681 start_codon:yes stop_codon:yes gene_type:complete
MRILYLIPARGGSKGLPRKNIKKLNGIPLIHYSIDFARKFTDDSNICVSTDDNEIIKCVEKFNLKINFVRPKNLSSDIATTHDVMIHAINYYESKEIYYDLIVLLQPTSPFRRVEDLKNMIKCWKKKIDLIVSVKEPHDSPYFNIYEENSDGYLVKSKESEFSRRQDVPKVYALNGSLYLFNVKSLKSNNLKVIKKYFIDDPIYSIDIDTPFDWMLCETVIKNNLF